MGGVVELAATGDEVGRTRANGELRSEYTATSSIEPLKYGLLEPQVLSPPTFH